VYQPERAANDGSRTAASQPVYSAGSCCIYFARAIGEVYAVRAAKIELDHAPNQERMEVENYTLETTAKPVLTNQLVSCGIPGHD
jgi:hypothetical protein